MRPPPFTPTASSFDPPIERCCSSFASFALAVAGWHLAVRQAGVRKVSNCEILLFSARTVHCGIRRGGPGNSGYRADNSGNIPVQAENVNAYRLF